MLRAHSHGHAMTSENTRLNKKYQPSYQPQPRQKTRQKKRSQEEKRKKKKTSKPAGEKTQTLLCRCALPMPRHHSNATVMPNDYDSVHKGYFFQTRVSQMSR